MIRITVGRATVEAEATEIRHATDDGVVPLYSVADVLNATVRTLRAIGTDDAAAAIDRLDGMIGDDSELEHNGDAPGTFDGVRVPFPASPSGYVWLSPEALLQAAAVQLEGAAGLPDVLTLTLAEGARIGVVLEEGGHVLNPRDYVVAELVRGGPGVAVGEAGSDEVVESPVPGSVIAVLTPVPLTDWR